MDMKHVSVVGTWTRILKVIYKLCAEKAPGFDQITVRLLKEDCYGGLRDQVFNLFFFFFLAGNMWKIRRNMG